jgi:hypothetical protein
MCVDKLGLIVVFVYKSSCAIDWHQFMLAAILGKLCEEEGTVRFPVGRFRQAMVGRAMIIGKGPCNLELS